MAYYFSLLIKTSNVTVLGITTEEEFYDYFEFDSKTKSRLEIIVVKEPKANEIYPMIKKVVKRLENIHGVTISRDSIDYVISVSSAFSSEIYEPELTMDIIEKSMIYAKRKNKKVVTKKHINQNFKFNYKLYNKMTDEDKK